MNAVKHGSNLVLGIGIVCFAVLSRHYLGMVHMWASLYLSIEQWDHYKWCETWFLFSLFALILFSYLFIQNNRGN